VLADVAVMMISMSTMTAKRLGMRDVKVVWQKMRRIQEERNLRTRYTEGRPKRSLVKISAFWSKDFSSHELLTNDTALNGRQGPSGLTTSAPPFNVSTSIDSAGTDFPPFFFYFNSF